MQARRPERAERTVSDVLWTPSLSRLENTLVRNWWTVALRGVLNIAFGLLALFWPKITFVALAIIFGAFAFVDGLFALGAALAGARSGGRRWPLVLDGVLGVGIGLVTLFFPGITVAALLLLIAAWAIVTGVFEIIEAVRLRREIEGEWLLALGGALSVVFGVLVLMYPFAGAVAVAWVIGAYAIAFGVVLLALGFRLRRIGRERRAEPERAAREQVEPDRG